MSAKQKPAKAENRITPSTEFEESPPSSAPESPTGSTVKCFEDIVNNMEEINEISSGEISPPANSDVANKLNKQWSFISQGSKHNTKMQGALDHPTMLKKSNHPIYRICITGGPCAGKTTSLATMNYRLV